MVYDDCRRKANQQVSTMYHGAGSRASTESLINHLFSLVNKTVDQQNPDLILAILAY